MRLPEVQPQPLATQPGDHHVRLVEPSGDQQGVGVSQSSDQECTLRNNLLSGWDLQRA
jgi:hypothetical protein